MVTQEQIAHELGVSRQLVTFALAGQGQVSAKSRERILAAAERMGYRPNPYARALRRSSTGIVSLWIPNQISTYYANVARELGRLVKQANQELIISEVRPDLSRHILSHVPIDGNFVVDVPERAGAYAEGFVGQPVPVVSMGGHCDQKADFVEVDLLGGTREVMKHLIGSGFRRIAHATLVTEDSPQARRRFGYLEAMAKAGLKPEFIYYPMVEMQRPVIRHLIQDYVRAHGCPEAIFCHSDDAAIAIYRGLVDMKIRVPDDVALVGCDGIPDTEYLECPLTTIVQPVAQMCAIAWKFMDQRLRGIAAEKQQAVISPELALRASSMRTQAMKFPGPHAKTSTISFD
ncbi:MAG: transcriptional regulator, LacI family [Pedosphaera sp.]|nr:transcriptional regulator, LacI family [Pedosphaera sp.]